MNTTSLGTLQYNPPGNLIVETSVSPSGKISFSNKNDKTPLPPLIEAFIDSNNKMQVNVIVFIDSSLPTPNFNAYQLYCISSSGTPKLQFFIDYDLKETSASNFNAYQITFEALKEDLPLGVTLKDVKSVEAFSWNIDPVTSRGTVTIVQDTD
ncbi:hypothetical protein [Snuella sedimenti]|uniref:Uncharacterized protein n=1 Tax=Snuella sedimenti TaxID=2798802 RepID=A0A8J7IJC9_9FLAO|nr:hypothetical protein [Snuella sedimenti]MBJ6369271.1 hypothetical protein [Snuella sedimenti]